MTITLVLSLRGRDRLVRVVSIMITITQQGQAGPAEAAAHLNATAGCGHSLVYDDKQEHEQE
jgi:hypothetical protein